MGRWHSEIQGPSQVQHPQGERSDRGGQGTEIAALPALNILAADLDTLSSLARHLCRGFFRAIDQCTPSNRSVKLDTAIRARRARPQVAMLALVL